MNNQQINIAFKVEGLDGYIRNLDDLKVALGQVDSETDGLASSTSNFNESIDTSAGRVEALKGAVDILGGSVEVLVGGLGLLGAQPAWLEAIEDGSAKAIAFADGLSRLADGVTDVRNFMRSYTTTTNANTTAIKAQDTATKAATVSTRTFSTVLKGAGIGLAIAGLAALVANWEKVLNFIGLGTKEFDDSLQKQIASLEKEQEIQEIRGQSVLESTRREAQLALLRAQNAENYVRYLREIGAEEEEIEQAVEDRAEAYKNLELSIERAEVAQNNFNSAQQELIDAARDQDLVEYYERLAFYTQQAADYEFNSLNQRLEANKLYFKSLQDQARLETSDRIVELNKQLEAGEITQETYNQLATAARQDLNNKLSDLDSEQAENSVQITQQSWNKRLDLASGAVSAIIALNEATAGASEAEQKKAFERNKKLQIGLATIQTAQAVTAALTAGGNPLKLATGAQFVEAGIAAATGLAQVLAIRKQTFDGGGGPAPVTGGAPNPGGSINYFFDQNAGETLTPGAQGQQAQQPQPIQAYVLATDVENGLQATQQIQNLSRL